MTAINAQDVKDLRKTRADLLDLKGWLLLEKLAAWCKGTPPRCTTSLDALRGVFGWSRTTIILRLDRIERLNLLQRRRRFQRSTVFTLTLHRLSKSPELDFHSMSESPDESPEVDENQPIETNGRAREGTAEAQGAGASAVPLGQRAPAHPARHPAHPLKSPAVKHALARERASLRSGDDAHAVARRVTPAPAPAQHFDIESWEPDPDQLSKLQAVRPDLDPEIIDEQLTNFRVWARTKGLKFRDAAECTRRLAGFVNRTHTPRRVARTKGSAGAERASSAKPSKATKTARRTASMDEAKLNGKRSRPATRREVSRQDLERLAEQAGGYGLSFRADDRVLLAHPENIKAGWENNSGVERTTVEAAQFLQRAIELKRKAAEKRTNAPKA